MDEVKARLLLGLSSARICAYTAFDYLNQLGLIRSVRSLTNHIWVRSLFQGSADPLNSAFHLTYNMVLNLLRVEEINPEYMLEKSFYQFQHYRALPGVVESK